MRGNPVAGFGAYDGGTEERRGEAPTKRNGVGREAAEQVRIDRDKPVHFLFVNCKDWWIAISVK